MSKMKLKCCLKLPRRLKLNLATMDHDTYNKWREKTKKNKKKTSKQANKKQPSKHSTFVQHWHKLHDVSQRHFDIERTSINKHWLNILFQSSFKFETTLMRVDKNSTSIRRWNVCWESKKQKIKRSSKY